MIAAAAGAHRIFFDGAQAGRRLARADNVRLGAGRASTTDAVAVAIPLRRHRKFSATRSAVRMPARRAVDRRDDVAGRDAAAIGRSMRISIAGSIRWKASRARSRPATRRLGAPRDVSWRGWSAGTMASVVMIAGAAEIFKQRRANERLDQDDAAGREGAERSLQTSGYWFGRRASRAVSQRVVEAQRRTLRHRVLRKIGAEMPPRLS